MLKLPSIPGLTNEGFLNLLFPLFAWSLDSIDIFRKQTFVYSHASCHFRNIQLRKSTEDSCYLIIIVRFFCIVETADMNVFVYFLPTDRITEATDLER